MTALLKNSFSRTLALITLMLCVVAPSVVVPSIASAGTPTTWTGGVNGSWSGTNNWNPSGNAPAAFTSGTTYSLSFGGTTQTTTTNNVGTVSIDQIRFTNAGGTGQNQFFTISGGTLAFNNASITTSSASGSPFIANSDGDTISSAMTLSGTTTVTTGALHNLSLLGNISGNGSLVFDDLSPGTTEYVYLSGSNSYTGGTQIRGGFVQTSARTPVSSSNNNAFGGLGGGTVTISDNGTLLVRNNSVIDNTLSVSGTGSLGNSLTGSFGTTSQIAEYRGAITVAGNTRFSTASSVAGDSTSKFLISGPIGLGSNTLTLRSGTTSGATAGLLIEVSGAISGAGGLVIDGAAATSRVLISSSNSYTGGTTITTGTLTVGNGSALGNGGFLAVNTNGLDLNGQALKVGALSGSSSGVIQSSVAGAASLTTDAAADSTYNGRIINGNGSAVVGLTKAGIGALTLTGSSSYTGPTTINGGNLVVDNQYAIGNSGNVTFGGGTLKYTSNNQVDYSSRIKTSGSAISIDTNGQNVTFASGIDSSNTGGLTKLGAGSLFINGVNTYTGNTVVASGTLGGSGTIAGVVTVGTSAFISPGSTAGGIGTLSVGALDLQSGATALMQISGTGAGQYDQIAALNSLNSVNYGGALAINFTTFGFANFDVWQLFSGTSQSGNFSSVTASFGNDTLTFTNLLNGEWKATGGWLADGQSMSFYVDNTHAIGGRFQAGQLVLVPEPSAFALMGIGVAVFGWRSLNRRRGTAG